MFDQCWIVLDAGVFKRIQHHPTILDFGTKTHDFDHASENVGRCCMKNLNIVKLNPTSSTFLIVLFKRAKHAASNNV